jgi:hypothetical protein
MLRFIVFCFCLEKMSLTKVMRSKLDGLLFASDVFSGSTRPAEQLCKFLESASPELRWDAKVGTNSTTVSFEIYQNKSERAVLCLKATIESPTAPIAICVQKEGRSTPVIALVPVGTRMPEFALLLLRLGKRKQCPGAIPADLACLEGQTIVYAEHDITRPIACADGARVYAIDCEGIGGPRNGSCPACCKINKTMMDRNSAYLRTSAGARSLRNVSKAWLEQHPRTTATELGKREKPHDTTPAEAIRALKRAAREDPSAVDKLLPPVVAAHLQRQESAAETVEKKGAIFLLRTFYA